MKYEKEYLENGFTCPFCGAESSVEGAEVGQNFGSEYWTKAECIECDKEWTEVYQLTRIIQ